MIERVHATKLPRTSCAAGLSFTFTEHRRYHTAIQIFQSKKLFPSYLLDVFRYSKDVTGYYGRNVNQLILVKKFLLT